MPFINVKTTAGVSAQKESVIKEQLARAMEKNLNKGESWLMIAFDEKAHIWFRGDDSAPSAMVEIKILGHATPEAFSAMTGDVCDILSKELSIPGERIYVKYEECENWGWNGSNF